MSENWIGEPTRLILVTPIIDRGTPNASIFASAHKAVDSLERHDQTRIDILYRNRSHSWAFTFHRKTDGDASEFIARILKECDQENKIMPLE